MSRKVEVQILGKNFSFSIPREIEPKEFLEIVDYVENKLNNIKSNNIDLDSFKLGLLTSINITEELFSLKKENLKLKQILDKIDDMISTLDNENKS